MRKVRVRTDGNDIRTLKQILLAISCFLSLFPLFVISVVDLKVNHLDYVIFLRNIMLLGFAMIISLAFATLLFSRDSPIKSLQIRKKLILFTRQFTNSTCDGYFKHSVEWNYTFEGNNKLIIELYSNGLVSDKAILGRELSEYLRLRLLKFEELDEKVRYIFGDIPVRFDGKKVLTND